MAKWVTWIARLTQFVRWYLTRFDNYYFGLELVAIVAELLSRKYIQLGQPFGYYIFLDCIRSLARHDQTDRLSDSDRHNLIYSNTEYLLTNKFVSGYY